jgi:hypothetical protein
MFYHFLNIINLYQISKIETLQVMEPISEKHWCDPNYCISIMIFSKNIEL